MIVHCYSVWGYCFCCEQVVCIAVHLSHVCNLFCMSFFLFFELKLGVVSQGSFFIFASSRCLCEVFCQVVVDGELASESCAASLQSLLLGDYSSLILGLVKGVFRIGVSMFKFVHCSEGFVVVLVQGFFLSFQFFFAFELIHMVQY
jgi:hypothetical protein